MKTTTSIKILEEEGILNKHSDQAGYTNTQIIEASAIYIMSQNDKPRNACELHDLIAGECDMSLLCTLNDMNDEEMEELFLVAQELV